MLEQGSTGSEVEVLQRRLAKAGFDPGPADGIFGPKTAAAVRAFQEDNALQVDGIVGPKTTQSLMSALMRMAGTAEAGAAPTPPPDDDATPRNRGI